MVIPSSVGRSVGRSVGGVSNTCARLTTLLVHSIHSRRWRVRRVVAGFCSAATCYAPQRTFKRCFFLLLLVVSLCVCVYVCVCVLSVQVGSFGPWVQENLARVDVLAAERASIAKKAAANYKKQYKERKRIYKELVAKQRELGEPIEPEPESDEDSD